jgi:hypothetical protein
MRQAPTKTFLGCVQTILCRAAPPFRPAIDFTSKAWILSIAAVSMRQDEAGFGEVQLGHVALAESLGNIAAIAQQTIPPAVR